VPIQVSSGCVCVCICVLNCIYAPLWLIYTISNHNHIPPISTPLPCYRHMPENQLTNLLNSMQLSKSPSDVSDMVGMAKGTGSGTGGHFGLACQKHFDLTHPDHSQMGIANSVRRVEWSGVIYMGCLCVMCVSIIYYILYYVLCTIYTILTLHIILSLYVGECGCAPQPVVSSIGHLPYDEDQHYHW